MTRTWVGTSWKMTKTLTEARQFAGALSARATADAWPGVQPFVIPPATALAAVSEILTPDHGVLLGAQNAHWEDSGAWTGEVSVPQVADAGARIVEIGHSERREHFAETIETTRLKVAATLRHGLIPLLCVGEDEHVNARGEAAPFIIGQVDGALRGLSAEQCQRVLIAYEPIWAIGENGRPATPEELAQPFAALNERFADRVEAILYGGSVNTANAEQLLDVPGVQGLFVGRAAWDAGGFLELLEIAAAAQ